ncbi:type IV pilin [Halococcoides cellulosivorans]|uniref:Type IV pilin n=1 Tax=Halococcoides cellulosivorans TaxID=1679096 RepID=A0A2R4X1Z7_9EURY|nr:type IV pilin N-terminal domain-containing protein [Halococcoides cellulosivorans]AWB27830.1 type IV pilin [Halococcoides cellulosivorans]
MTRTREQPTRENQTMKLNEMFTDDSAVSPVIGVVLMVAITVILAGTVGLMVTQMDGLAADSGTSAVAFDYDSGNSTSANITVTNAPAGENALNLEDIEIQLAGEDVTDSGPSTSFGSSGTLTAGNQALVHIDSLSSPPADIDGLTVRVVYTGGGSSTVIGEHTF